MKKDVNSNRYIFLYATILIIIVAVLLTVTALWLQPFQDRNKKNEKRISILTAAGIPNVDAKNAPLLFEKHCTGSFLLDESGNISDDGTLPLFVIDRQISVIPMQGNGLWGPIWGFSPLLPTARPFWAPTSTTSRKPLVWAVKSLPRNSKVNSLENRYLKMGTSFLFNLMPSLEQPRLRMELKK